MSTPRNVTRRTASQLDALCRTLDAQRRRNNALLVRAILKRIARQGRGRP